MWEMGSQVEFSRENTQTVLLKLDATQTQNTSDSSLFSSFRRDKKRPCTEGKQGLLGRNVRRMSVQYENHFHTR